MLCKQKIAANVLPYNSLFPANVFLFTAIAAILPQNTRTDILWAFRVQDRSGDCVGAARLRIDLLSFSITSLSNLDFAGWGSK